MFAQTFSQENAVSSIPRNASVLIEVSGPKAAARLLTPSPIVRVLQRASLRVSAFEVPREH
jgi:hypothetical protein